MVATLPPTALPQDQPAQSGSSDGQTTPEQATGESGSTGGDGNSPASGSNSAGGGGVATGGQSVPITGQSNANPVTISDLEEDNLLDIVSYGGSGQVNYLLACNFVFASEEQAAANSARKRVPSGTVLAYDDIDSPDGPLNGGLFATPRICAIEPGLLGGAVAVSPSGVGYAPVAITIQTGSVYGVVVPFEAFRQPGVWRLQVATRAGLYELGINMPAPTVPVTRRYERSVWVGGFGGGERVRGYGDAGDDWDYLEFQADGQGYALFTTPVTYGALYLAGESGRVALPGLLTWHANGSIAIADRDLLAEWLYLELWQGGAPPDMLPSPDAGRLEVVFVTPDTIQEAQPSSPLVICNNGGLPSRLTVGGKVKVVPNGGYALHHEPGKLGDVALVIPQGTTLSVADGPVCADGVWWWKVEWSLNMPVAGGWLPETGGGIYILEPVN